jgi:hypothetical protein
MTVPIVVEAWAVAIDHDYDVAFHIFINRTRVASQTTAWVRKDGNARTLVLEGCSMTARVKMGRKPVRVAINVETPYVRLTSDGKTPELGYLDELTREAVSKAVDRVRRNERDEKQPSQKEAVLACLDDGVAHVSGGGEHRFNLRNLFYAIREFMKKRFQDAKEVKFGWFSQIITAHEDEIGHDVLGITRDNRGTLYHPHTGQEIPLGTLNAEQYRRPEWLFNKILYSEKEGFFEILKDEKWPERHDCALLTSKGFASRAARDLLDLLGDTDEELFFYCIHDADAAGTMIFQSLQEATKARPARKVTIVNLGLEPEEALAMGLDPEPVERDSDKALPVARYVAERWQEWLQTHRVELNAMSTPEFLAWLDAKFADQPGKVAPPADVMGEALKNHLEQSLRDEITEHILAEAGIDERVAKAMRDRDGQVKVAHATLTKKVARALDKAPEEPWSAPVERIAERIASSEP